MSVGLENGQQRNQASGQPGEAPDLGVLKEDVQEIAGAAVERGKQFIDSARHQATDYVDRRKGDVAQSVADLATSLREATSSFEDRPNVRAFADSAAQGLDQLAETIRERSLPEFYADVEEVMRRRPAAIAAVAATAGFIIARLLRASSENVRAQHSSRQGRAAYGGPPQRRTPRPSDM